MGIAKRVMMEEQENDYNRYKELKDENLEEKIVQINDDIDQIIEDINYTKQSLIESLEENKTPEDISDLITNSNSEIDSLLEDKSSLESTKEELENLINERNEYANKYRLTDEEDDYEEYDDEYTHGE